MNHTTLAKAVLEAATIREDSFQTIPNSTNGHYSLSYREAADQACAKLGCQELAEPVSLLLIGAWNDAIKWANKASKEG